MRFWSCGDNGSKPSLVTNSQTAHLWGRATQQREDLIQRHGDFTRTSKTSMTMTTTMVTTTTTTRMTMTITTTRMTMTTRVTQLWDFIEVRGFFKDIKDINNNNDDDDDNDNNDEKNNTIPNQT